MLINCKVKHIYFAQAYPDELSEAMVAEAGIGFELLSGSFGS
jgi:dCMP deaminase